MGARARPQPHHASPFRRFRPGVNGSHSGELTLAKCGNFLQSKGPFAMADQKALGPAGPGGMSQDFLGV